MKSPYTKNFLGKHLHLESEVDYDNVVICDFCSTDYTDREDIGGALIGSYAICPKCTEKAIQKEIEQRCPMFMQFRHWVLQLRGGNNSVKVYSSK